jgi:hypothetical protein
MKGTLVSENFHIRNEITKKFKEFITQRSGKPEMSELLKVIAIMLLKLEP